MYKNTSFRFNKTDQILLSPWNDGGTNSIDEAEALNKQQINQQNKILKDAQKKDTLLRNQDSEKRRKDKESREQIVFLAMAIMTILTIVAIVLGIVTTANQIEQAQKKEAMPVQAPAKKVPPTSKPDSNKDPSETKADGTTLTAPTQPSNTKNIETSLGVGSLQNKTTGTGGTTQLGTGMGNQTINGGGAAPQATQPVYNTDLAQKIATTHTKTADGKTLEIQQVKDATTGVFTFKAVDSGGKIIASGATLADLNTANGNCGIFYTQVNGVQASIDTTSVSQLDSIFALGKALGQDQFGEFVKISIPPSQVVVHIDGKMVLGSEIASYLAKNNNQIDFSKTEMSFYKDTAAATAAITTGAISPYKYNSNAVNFDEINGLKANISTFAQSAGYQEYAIKHKAYEDELRYNIESQSQRGAQAAIDAYNAKLGEPGVATDAIGRLYKKILDNTGIDSKTDTTTRAQFQYYFENKRDNASAQETISYFKDLNPFSIATSKTNTTTQINALTDAITNGTIPVNSNGEFIISSNNSFGLTGGNYTPAKIQSEVINQQANFINDAMSAKTNTTTASIQTLITPTNAPIASSQAGLYILSIAKAEAARQVTGNAMNSTPNATKYESWTNTAVQQLKNGGDVYYANTTGNNIITQNNIIGDRFLDINEYTKHLNNLNKHNANYAVAADAAANPPIVAQTAEQAILANNKSFDDDAYAAKTMNSALKSYTDLSFGQNAYKNVFTNLYQQNNIYSDAVPSTINGKVQGSGSGLYYP